jgi:Leucine-rich repeat (LRR) protein
MAWKFPDTDQVRGWIHTLRGRRRDEALFLIATFLGSAAGSVKLWPEEILHLVQPYHPALVLGGLAALAYSVWLVRIWRQAQAPRREIIDRPMAVKGPASFGPQDGELFQALGRADELRTLLGFVLDDQIGLVVLKGESGAGKTSLLRSGLPFVLATEKAGKIPCFYWEALPSDSEERLLEAIERQFDPPEAAPATLVALAELDDTTRVIVIDQLEQLDPKLPAHAPLFELLRQVGQRRPPFRVTWILAFRQEFASAWFDFETAHPDLRFQKKTLELFHPKAAEEVLATLAEAAKLTLDRGLVAELVGSATNADGRVSPVDLGIGLLILHELARARHTDSLSLTDYRFAGGSEHLLAAYLLRCLDDLRDEDRRDLLKGLLLLVDLPTNRRVAEGRIGKELATEAARPLAWMTKRLDALCDDRVLERRVDSRFRLQHERLIPPLRALSGEILAEADRARIVLQEAYARWLRHPRNSALLAGTDLRLVAQHRKTLLGREPKLVGFVGLSLRRQRMWQGAVAAGLLLFLGGLALAGRAFDKEKERSAFLAQGLPTDLGDHLAQLKSLHLSANLATLDWLRGPLEEVDLNAASLHHLPSFPPELTRLTVRSPRASLIASLSGLPNLEELSLIDLGELNRLGDFPRLHTLALFTMGPIDDLRFLGDLPLRRLTVHEFVSQDWSEPLLLPRLPNLEVLELSTNRMTALPKEGYPELRQFQIISLRPLSELFPVPGCKYLHRRIPNLETITSYRNEELAGCFPRVRRFFLNEGLIIICGPVQGVTKAAVGSQHTSVSVSAECIPDHLPKTVRKLEIRGRLNAKSIFSVARLIGIGELEFTSSGLNEILPAEPNEASPTGVPLLPWVKILRIEGSASTLVILRHFSNLESLTVQINGSESITALPTFPFLRVLKLSGACPPTLKNLPPLPKLESLDVSGCPLTSLEGLPPTVKELKL